MGGSDYPLLFWQTELHLRPQTTALPDYVFRSIEAQLLLPNHQKIADATSHPLQRVLRGHDVSPHSEYLNLEFPLDARRIESLEHHRNGGALRLRIKVQLQVEEHGIVDGHAETKRPPLSGLRAVHRLTLEDDIEIPQSVWIERVLPQIGYGKVHVLELPAMPIAACQSSKHAFDALHQAQELHKIGLYDDAVGKCRVALEKFFESVDVPDDSGKTRRVPILKKSWETKLGEATYGWLNASLTAIKDASNPPHHSPNAHFDQMEAQMILAITTAVVAYAARTDGATS
jgi:hypothetical protein